MPFGKFSFSDESNKENILKELRLLNNKFDGMIRLMENLTEIIIQVNFRKTEEARWNRHARYWQQIPSRSISRSRAKDVYKYAETKKYPTVEMRATFKFYEVL